MGEAKRKRMAAGKPPRRTGTPDDLPTLPPLDSVERSPLPRSWLRHRPIPPWLLRYRLLFAGILLGIVVLVVLVGIRPAFGLEPPLAANACPTNVLYLRLKDRYTNLVFDNVNSIIIEQIEVGEFLIRFENRTVAEREMARLLQDSNVATVRCERKP